MLVRIALALVAVLLASDAWTKDCPESESLAAHYAAPQARTWTELHAAFLEYGHCDDGAIAGEFSESVSFILADRWQSFREGAVLMNREPAFKEFVLGHLGEVTPRDLWDRILMNASSQCPAGEEALCRQISSQE